MKVTPTPLPGVLLLEPSIYHDDRGFFYELFNADRFAAHNLPTAFPQDNHSRSRRGTLRGLHYQLRRPQGKLVTVLRGEIFDVTVDIRRGSPSFGSWFGTRLTEAEPRVLWVPAGFAHGFCALSDIADVIYKCTDVYVPDDDHGIIWSDPALDIDWPVRDPILSPKDRTYSGLDPSRADLPEYTA